MASNQVNWVAVPSCPVCGTSRRTKLGLRGEGPIRDLDDRDGPTTTVWSCRGCHHVWCDPAPTEASLAPRYEAATGDYFDVLDAEGPDDPVALLTAAVPEPGRLLDIGCGTGRLMGAAAARGWTVAGVEPVATFAGVAVTHGPVVGSLDDVEGTFDAIALIAVLEHVHDPVGMLRRAREHAAPGCMLLAQVPQAHRPEAWMLDRILRLAGRPWTVRTAPLHAPFHLSEFSRRSLSEALERAGWEVSEVWVEPGHNSYPLPRLAGSVVRVVERLGGLLGYGLEVVGVARTRH